MKKIVLSLLFCVGVLSGCGVRQGQSSIEYEPNSNQLSQAKIHKVVIEELYWNAKQPLKSITVQGALVHKILDEIDGSKIVILPSNTKLVTPAVGPKTIVYAVVVPGVDTFRVGPAWSGTYDEQSQSNLSPGLSISMLKQVFSHGHP